MKSEGVKFAPIVTLTGIAPSLSSIPEDDYKVTLVDDNWTNNNLVLTESKDTKPKIPDGGWGWMVVFASMMVCLIQDGLSFSFGMLYDDLKTEFDASASSVAWVGSLFVSVPLLTGPIMSALVDRYGCRSMTILGGLITTSGFLLSRFARTINVLYLTFGILAGLGLGLTFVTSVVCIAFWFEKKRNLAVGLGACGIGIGTFIYAPLTAYLLEQFQWRGTFVLLGGTVLHMCICGALMRDPDWIIEQNKESSSHGGSSSVSISSAEEIDFDQIRVLLQNGKDADYILQAVQRAIKAPQDGGQHGDGDDGNCHQSVLNLPTFVKENEKVFTINCCYRNQSTMIVQKQVPVTSTTF